MGIYQIKNGKLELSICFDGPANCDRPKEFKSEQRNRHFYVTFQKE